MRAGTWLVLLASGVLAAPAAVRADTRIGIGVTIGSAPRDHRGAYSFGFDRGLRDGAEEGHDDGRHHRDFDFGREGDYRKGLAGYRGWMGPRWEYADGYRRGYESGYRRAYATARRGYRDNYAYERYRYGDRDRNGDRDRYDDRDQYDDRCRYGNR